MPVIRNIRSDDYLQVLSYMFRFDAKKGYYFYPEIDNTADSVYWLNSGSTYEKNVRSRDDICIVKHGLKIPQNADSYEQFVELIKQSEQDFLYEFVAKGTLAK